MNERLEEYQGFDLQGGLTILSDRRVPFKWKVERYPEIVWCSRDLKYILKPSDILRLPFYFYYHQINAPEEAERIAEIAKETMEIHYKEHVQLHVDLIRRGIQTLQATHEATGRSRKRTGKLNSMLKDLEESEGLLREVLTSHFAGEIRQTAGRSGMMMDSKGHDAEALLIITQYDCFREVTTLTRNDAIDHIVELLDHFDIRESEDPSFERIRKIVSDARAEK